jgi:hypothetical protein
MVIPRSLQVHGVEHLGFHFTRGRQATAHLDETVGQRRLAMVDVGDDGEIADMTQITHGSTLEKAASRPKNSRELYLKLRGYGRFLCRAVHAMAPAIVRFMKKGSRSCPFLPANPYSASLKVMKLARP